MLFFVFTPKESFSNLLKNFSFEETLQGSLKPKDWNLPSWSFDVCVSSDKYYSGSFSLKISSNNIGSVGRNFFVYQDVPVKEFYTYHYGVKVLKTDQNILPAGIAIKSSTLNWNENWYERPFMSTGTISNKDGWQELFSSTTIPAGITKIRVHIVVRNTTPNGNCEVYFDDAFLLKDEVPPQSITDLFAYVENNKINLTWTSVGNDGNNGVLLYNSQYIINYSTSYLEAIEMTNSTENAKIIISTYNVEAFQKQSISIDEEIIEGLTYYFCIWTKDNSDNYSSVSNLATLFLGINLPNWLKEEIEVSSSSIKWKAIDNSLVEDAIYISSAMNTYSRLSNNLGPLEGKQNPIFWLEENLLPNEVYIRYIEVVKDNTSFWCEPCEVCTYSLAPNFFKVSCKVEDNQMVNILSWSSSPAEGYVVVFTTKDFSLDFSTLSVLSKQTTFYIHKDVNPNTTYYYRIYSYNKDRKLNYNHYNETFIVTLPSSLKLFAEPISSTAIKWFWEKNEDVNGFRIYSSDKELIADILASNTFYIETGLEVNNKYTRYIVAYNSTSEGQKSNEVSIYTLSNPLKNLEIKKVSYNSVIISYDSNNNPPWTEYEVFVSTDNVSFTNYLDFKNLKQDEIIVDNLRSNTTYWFKMRTKNGDGIYSEFSNIVSTLTLKLNSPIITQFATRGISSSYDEFVEIWNCLSEEIDISNFILEYWNGNSWVNKITIPQNTKLSPYSFYLIASSSDYFKTTFADLYHKSYLNLADGEVGSPRGVRIINGFGDVIDTVVYEGTGGTPNDLAEGGLTSVSCGNKPTINSVMRKKDNIGFYIDTNNNYNDFFITVRNPKNSNFSIYGITDLQAFTTQNEGEVKLCWTANSFSEVLEYRIKYSTYDFKKFDANDSFNVELTTSSGKVCVYINCLEPSLTYYFAVIFKDIDNSWKVWIKDEALNINTLNYAYANDFPPNPVEKVEVISLNRALKIKWEHPKNYDLDKYVVYVATYSFYSLDGINDFILVNYPTNEVIIKGLENELTYYISVVSIDKGFLGYDVLMSSYFKVFTGIPYFSAPNNLNVAIIDKKIRLSWEVETFEDILGFNVYCSTDGINFYFLGFTEDPFYEDSNLRYSDIYYYVCKVDKESYESKPSSIIKVYFDLIPPRLVFLEEFKKEFLTQELAKIKIKIEDDRFTINDLKGNIVSVKGVFRGVNSDYTKYILVEKEPTNNNSLFEGYLIFDFKDLNINYGIEYYFEITDGINITRVPNEGWVRVLNDIKDKKENYFLSLKNPKIIFKDAKYLKVFSVSGREVLCKQEKNSSYIILEAKDLNGKFLESGIYIYNLTTTDNKKKYGYIIFIK